MSWQTLIAVSRTLTSTSITSQIDQQTANEHRRKAVSAAYYTMFHAVVKMVDFSHMTIVSLL